jgi:hypothetical protein
MSMGEAHERGNTACAYDGVNEVNPSFIAQSFHQLLDQILPFASSSIDELFPSPGQ